MLRQILPAVVLLVPAVASAQSAGGPEPAPPPVHAGTYVVATGEFIPANGSGAPEATPGVIYNANTFVGSFTSSFNDTVQIDEGRVPSTTSPSPAKGVRNSYLVTGFQIGYATREVDLANGGPGAEINVLFWDDYDDCGTLAGAGTPVASFNLSGLPASATLGTVSAWTVDVDLTGFEFCLTADADGVYDGDQDLDGFGYAYQFVNQVSAIPNVGGPLLAGGPANAPVGDGTFYQNPGAASGTGLDNDDLWVREGANGQTSGCFFFGGNPYASFWMQITADLDDCTCVGVDCNGNGVDDACDIATGFSQDCNGNDIPDECEPDCNGNGQPDDCDVASGYSLDLDGSGLPDECEPGAGTPYCFGNGCPCGNDDPLAGCANSTGQGALLYSFGGDSVGAHDTELYAIHLPTSSVGLYFMGDAQLGGGAGIPLFDGLACVGGTSRRFPLQFTGLGGVIALLDPATTYSALIVPGSTWNFTAWYRNPVGSPCGTNANFSNAVSIDFLP